MSRLQKNFYLRHVHCSFNGYAYCGEENEEWTKLKSSLIHKKLGGGGGASCNNQESYNGPNTTFI